MNLFVWVGDVLSALVRWLNEPFYSREWKFFLDSPDPRTRLEREARELFNDPAMFAAWRESQGQPVDAVRLVPRGPFPPRPAEYGGKPSVADRVALDAATLGTGAYLVNHDGSVEYVDPVGLRFEGAHPLGDRFYREPDNGELPRPGERCGCCGRPL